MALDAKAVGAGAAVAVAILLPVLFVVAALDPGKDSPVPALAVFTLFAASTGGGWVAARTADRSPLLNAATAACGAWAVVIAVSILRRLSSSRPVTLKLLLTEFSFLQVSVVLAMAGGWMAHRHRVAEQAD